MKWLADENIPLASAKILRQAGFDVISISERQPGLADQDVLRWAHRERRVLLTFDRDFGELIFQQRVFCPPAVVYLRFVPESPAEPANVVLAMLECLSAIEGNFIVLDRDNFRKRPLPQAGANEQENP